MTNILSPYYSPWHWRGEDERYMRELDPAWINIHQPTARAIHTAQQAAPNAKIMLRSWDIDDHNGDRKREMYADPRGAARKHIEMWRAKLKSLQADLGVNGWSFDGAKWHMGLVNEPDPAFVPQVVEYSLEAMRIAQEWGWHLGVVASSVGNFKKPSEGPEGWTQFIPLERPINDGGHILLVHEYWQPEGPSFGEDAGNLAWRHHSIPLDVPILIREAGANGYIYGRYSKEDDSGWQKTVADPKPETFAAQVKEYIEGCDERVQGVCLYMLDFHSKQWQSFDTQPAMEQLLAIKDARPQVPSPFAKKPTRTILPSVETGTKPVEQPMNNAIIEPRAAQAILKIESGGRTHGDDGRIIIRFEAHIFKTYFGNNFVFHQHFGHDAHRPWVNQTFEGKPLHTGKQADEYAAFEFAKSLNAEAAYKSISMGAPQIMGFNHARIGYPSAAAMFASFQDAQLQTIGFINFCLSDPELAAAMRRKDWRIVAAKYNGAGAVDRYSKLLEQAYNQLGA